MNDEFPGQALCVVGYDDDKYGGAFEVMNSWGKDWGNNGFTWIRYDDFLAFVKYAYELYHMSADEMATKLSGSVELKLNTNKACTHGASDNRCIQKCPSFRHRYLFSHLSEK
jgi:hypothetical protein